MTIEKKVVNREQEVHFTNFTSEEFRGQWARKLYPLKPGKTYYLPFYLAEKFASDLVDRELNIEVEAEIAKARAAKPDITQPQISQIYTRIFNNVKRRQEMMDKCVYVPGDVQVDMVMPKEVPVREVHLQSDDRLKRYVDEGRISREDAASMGVKPAVVSPQISQSTSESSFEGLQDQQ